MGFVLKIELMADKSRLRYMQQEGGSTFDMVSLPIARSTQAVHVTCTKFPGDTKTEIPRSRVAEIIRDWRQEAIETILVDHRNAIQEVTLPSGLVLNRSSNLLLLVKALQQFQRGEMVLAQDDAQALRMWVGNRVPFGMEAVDAIKNMKAMDQLEDI